MSLDSDVERKQNILVLNDEAHHAYRIRQAGSIFLKSEALDEEAIEEFAQEATVWIDGLDRIQGGGSTSASICPRRRTTWPVPAPRRTGFSRGW